MDDSGISPVVRRCIVPLCLCGCECALCTCALYYASVCASVLCVVVCGACFAFSRVSAVRLLFAVCVFCVWRARPSLCCVCGVRAMPCVCPALLCDRVLCCVRMHCRVCGIGRVRVACVSCLCALYALRLRRSCIYVNIHGSACMR